MSLPHARFRARHMTLSDGDVKVCPSSYSAWRWIQDFTESDVQWSLHLPNASVKPSPPVLCCCHWRGYLNYVPLPGSSDHSNCQQREWCCFSPEPPSIHCCRAELRFRMAGKEPVTPLGAETTVAVLEPAPFQHNSLIMHWSKSNSTKLKSKLNKTQIQSKSQQNWYNTKTINIKMS